MIRIGTVVQFNENHKWCGCLGIVTEAKMVGGADSDIRYMVGVPIPEKGTAYIFVLKSVHALEIIGQAILVEGED